MTVCLALCTVHSTAQQVLKSPTSLVEQTGNHASELAAGATNSNLIAEDESVPRVPGLTAEENAWLVSHPVIPIGAGFDWPPFNYVDRNNHHQGAVADVIKLIGERLGVQFELDASRPWNDMLAAVKKGEPYAAAAIAQPPGRQPHFYFSAPYCLAPPGMVIRSDHQTIRTFGDIAHRRVAVPRGFADAELLRYRFPAIEIVDADDTQQALEMVRDGHVEAFVGSQEVAAYLINQQGISGLHVLAGDLPIRSTELRVGTSRNYPLLASAVQKALDTISVNELDAVMRRWLTHSGAGVVLAKRIEVSEEEQRWLGFAAFFVIVLLVATAWIFGLLRQRWKIRAAEQRYELAMDDVSETVWDWDLRNGRRYFSPGFFLHMGYSLEEIPIDHAGWSQLLHPDDREVVEKKIKRHMERKGDASIPLSMEYRVRCKDGKYVYAQSRGRVTEWDGDEPIRRRGTMHDITELRVAEQALTKSEEFLRGVYEGIEAAIFVIDVEDDGVFRIVAGNPASARISGLDVKDVMGLEPADVFSAKTTVTLTERFRDCVHSGYVVTFEQDFSVQNRSFWWLISLTPLTEGKARIHRIQVYAPR